MGYAAYVVLCVWSRTRAAFERLNRERRTVNGLGGLIRSMPVIPGSSPNPSSNLCKNVKSVV